MMDQYSTSVLSTAADHSSTTHVLLERKTTSSSLCHRSNKIHAFRRGSLVCAIEIDIHFFANGYYYLHPLIPRSRLRYPALVIRAIEHGVLTTNDRKTTSAWILAVEYMYGKSAF